MNTKRYNKIWGLGLNTHQQRAVLKLTSAGQGGSPAGGPLAAQHSQLSVDAPHEQHDIMFVFSCVFGAPPPTRLVLRRASPPDRSCTSWQPNPATLYKRRRGWGAVSPHFSTVSLPGPCTMWELFLFYLGSCCGTHNPTWTSLTELVCVKKKRTVRTSEETEGVTSEVTETSDRPRHYRSNSFHLPAVFYHLWIKHKRFSKNTDAQWARLFPD